MDDEASKSEYADKEASKSEYAYMLSSVGLINIEISNIETKPQFKLGLAMSAEPGEIPFGSGVFSHSNSVYLFGGRSNKGDRFSSRLLQFDHNKFQKLPPNSNIPSFNKFLKRHRSNYAPIILPRVVRTPDGVKTYVLSDTYMNWEVRSAFQCQSFDAIENVFTKHALPPIHRFPNGLDPPYGLFLLGPCLYLFISPTDYTPPHTFTFNTSLKSSIWRVNEELASQFDIKDIPPPYDHRGDIGLSKEYDDKSRIMLAHDGGILIAYRIHIEQGWESFTPISHRLLTEIYTPHPATRQMDAWTHLTDFGGGKFCVFYGSKLGLTISVFRIDFDIEHHIQSSRVNPDQIDSGQSSSEILGQQRFCLKEELANLTLSCTPYFSSKFCFLSALPASTATRKSPPTPRKDDDKNENHISTPSLRLSSTRRLSSLFWILTPPFDTSVKEKF